MSRSTWVNIHLYLAAFLSPMLLLVAISGGLYLLGYKGTTEATPVEFPADIKIDIDSPTLDGEVYTALRQAGINHDFEYIRKSGSTLTTRPTSKGYYVLQVSKRDITVTRHDPDLQKVLIELHKGHGPLLFKDFQKFLSVGLMVIVLSGFWLGLTSPGLRFQSVGLAGAGLLVFLMLAFFM